MELSIESLGFDKEEIKERIIELAADRLLSRYESDEDGVDEKFASDLKKKLEKVVIDRIDAAVVKIADEHILPNAAQFIDNVTFQETNKWGEPQKPKLTYREYLAQRAENYLSERVNYQGKTEKEDSYNWRGDRTRIAYMVEKHIMHHIEETMKKCVADANSQIAEGITGAVKMKLAEVMNSLKVSAVIGK